MNELILWKFILKTISSSKKAVLLIVAESSNSSPGRQGFKMVISEDAEQFGTIGGGIMEKDMIEYSLDLLFGNETNLIKKLHHTDKTKFDKSGLICGGYQTILFSVFDKSNITIIKNILSSLNIKENGKLKVTPGKIEFLQSEDRMPTTFQYNSDVDWQYTEAIGLPLIAYIAGGGHVGLGVSRVMKTLGFYVVVFDHREDVFTMKQNEYADEIIITKYEDIGNRIIESERSYIIIVTPMHAGDKDTLKSVIHKNVKYIGMMGSKRKIKSIFDALIKEGIDNELFKKVHTPIGIEIEAETPEEIAISIGAEIIKVKNQR
ncbi:MAG: XdhC family protein [Melioribacteraceae bacterium]|nr:XdhC family protein [Melioribacteraceae bacterium]